ncbi:MAG TPA: hypothetical protein VNV85_10415 [Puia sp.]|jgi:hypothetical protein|nr:hypothetical protein [Puia sp.]
MQKILSILAILFFGWAASGQSIQNNNYSKDSTYRHRGYRNWTSRDGHDSLHKRNFRHGGMYWGEASGRNYDYGRMNGFARNVRALHLTPDQIKQMRTINLDFGRKSSALYSKDDLTLGEYKVQLQALQRDRRSKLQALLSPEQKNEIAEFKKTRQENVQVRAAAHLERMKIHLQLSDSQVAAIKSQQQNLHSQVQTIRENDLLNRDQKTEQIQALFSKHKDAIKSVLTPGQITEFENMHTRRLGAK